MKTQRTHKAPWLDTGPADRNRRGCHWAGNRGDILPRLAVTTIILIISVILLIFGIEQIVGEIFLYKSQRGAHIGIGIEILVIILAGFAMAFPEAATAFVILLAAVALLVSGASSLIAGLTKRERDGNTGNVVIDGNRSICDRDRAPDIRH
jgi:Short repeat of unknown function (DUF308)